MPAPPAACSYFNQPLYWLRMAEASSGLFQQLQRQLDQQRRRDAPAAASSHPLLAGVIVAGQQRRLLLPEGHAPSAVAAAAAAAAEEAADGAGGGGGEGLPSIQLLHSALDYLGTAAALLQELKAAAAQESEGAAAEAAAAAAAAADAAAVAAVRGGGGGSPGANASDSPFRREGFGAGAAASLAAAGAAAQQQVRLSDVPAEDALERAQQAVLANQSHVHLLLEDPVPALAAAKQLLACSNLSQAQQFLGSCYAAEALSMLGRPQEASEQLSSYMALYMAAGDEPSSTGGGTLNTVPPATTAASAVAAAAAAAAPPRSTKSDDEPGGRPESYTLGNAADIARLTGPAARAAVHANLAAVAALQRDISGCAAAARAALAVQPDHREAALLLVWAELACGNSTSALAILKQGQLPPQ